MKVVTATQMKAVEQVAEEWGVSTDTLMENAGLAVARRVWDLLGRDPSALTLVLVGPGKNGGDGLVCARRLAEWGGRVMAYLCTPRPEPDPKRTLARETGVEEITAEEDPGLARLREGLASARVVVDAVLGTGPVRPLEGTLKTVFQALAEEKARRPSLWVVALDLPTGLRADTGEVDPLTPWADLTLTLGLPKMGLFLHPGLRRAGRLEVLDIGLPPGAVEEAERRTARQQTQQGESPLPWVDFLTVEGVRPLLPHRPLWAHKGSFGRVLVVAGSRPYIGAAYLACMGAVRVGAGLVTLAVPPFLQQVLASKLTEVTYLPLPESDAGGFFPHTARQIRERLREGYNTLLMGCGMGMTPNTEALVRHILLGPEALPGVRAVLDADALNSLAETPRWWESLKCPAVLTPHAGEMARLVHQSPEAVNRRRIPLARDLAREWKTVVVLKGAYTVVASPDGRCAVSPFANPGLASAGTGDVLAGVIAGLLAQGLEPYESACAGVFLHGLAGEWVRADLGEAGMTASDLLPLLPRVLRAVREGRATPSPPAE